MIQTQTFELNKTAKDELAVISKVLSLISEKRYIEAEQTLIRRQDELTKEPVLKLYDQRQA